MRDLTIVFDLDGTLVDTAPDLIGATNHALATRGLDPIRGGALRPWISYGARRMIVEGLALRSARASDAEVDQLLEMFLDYYEANIARESRPFEGAVEVLDACLAHGARLAVCTNKREFLSRLLLDQLGLTPRFAALAGRDTLSVCKPDPGHLLGAIQMAGGRPDRAVMIGDSDVDIATAKAARIPVIGVTFGYTETPVTALGADAVADHYSEILPLIQRLAACP